MNITTCLGVYNNLDLTKSFYKLFRKQYPNEELSISSGGSTDGTLEWLASLNDRNLIIYEFGRKVSFSENFNQTIKQASKDKIVLVHNDLILGKNFLELIDKTLINKKNILSYTTIEPPIFSDHERLGKIIKDFGYDFNSFRKEEFNKFVLNYLNNEKIKIDDGSTFFLSAFKDDILSIGGFDGKTYNRFFCEDYDLLLRLKLNGCTLKTHNKILSYHFVSKTSRFSKEYENTNNIINEISAKNFFRKWGVAPNENLFKSDFHKYKITFVINNVKHINVLKTMEPRCSFIYTDNEYINKKYIEKEKDNVTVCNLNEKIGLIKDFDINKVDGIIVQFDSLKVNKDNFTFIIKLPYIIENSGSVGNLKYDIFKLTIKDLKTYEQEKINC